MKRWKLYVFTLLALGISARLEAQQWSLDSCLNYAMNNNKAILAGHQTVRSSELTRKSSLAQLAPEIEASADLDHYWKIPVQVFPGELIGEPEGAFIPVRLGTPWMGNYGINANIPLLDPSSWQDIKLATLQMQSSQSEIASLERHLSRNVEMAFYQVLQEQQNQTLAKQRLSNYKTTHGLIKSKFGKGLTDKIAFNQSLSLLKDRENDLIAVEQALQMALYDLKYWMGYPLQGFLDLATDHYLYSGETIGYDPTLLPDYKIEKLKVELAQQQLKVSRSLLYPHVSLNGNFNRLGFGESINFIGNSEWFTSGSFGLQIRIPLFSLQKMSYAPQRQKSELMVVNLQFENYLEEQKRKYLQATMQMGKAWESVLIEQENVGLAEENKSLATQKIEKGIIDMIQLKQIEQDLTRAFEKLHQAQLNFLKYAVELNYLQPK